MAGLGRERDGVDASPTALVCQSGGCWSPLNRRRPCRKLARSVWTWRSECFKHTEQMRPARWYSVSGCGEQVLTFFADRPACVVAMEACSSAHYWARAIGEPGHTVRLIPPAYVKPFVKRQKNDTTDAEGDLRGGAEANDALCVGEERSSPGQCGCIPSSGSSGAAADTDDQLLARPSRGIWGRCGQRSLSRPAAHLTRRGSGRRFT